MNYMYSCGDVGKGMADQILLRVPLKLREQNDSDRIREGDIVGVLKDVNETCFQHQREAVRRTICRVSTIFFLMSSLTFINLDCGPDTCTGQRLWLGSIILYLGGRLVRPRTHRRPGTEGVRNKW